MVTVEKLIEVLKQRPPESPVFIWDSEARTFRRVSMVSNPAAAQPQGYRGTLPPGAVVVWGVNQ